MPIEEVFNDFKRAFFRVDREALEGSITPDFEWHVHWQESTDDEPTGKVLRGPDQVFAEIERRREQWTELSYDDVEERFLDDLIVQTFVVSGVDADGRRFSTAAVDLYPIRDGLIAGKRTYWKQW